MIRARRLTSLWPRGRVARAREARRETVRQLLPPGIRDERSQALLTLVEQRLAAIPLAPLAVYDVAAVPAALLPVLAWQFDALGDAGWDLATTDDARRALVRRALLLHRRRGTPWAIREALTSLGFTVVRIDEGYGRPVCDGLYLCNGLIDHSAGVAWGFFRVVLGDAVENLALTNAWQEAVARVIEFWKNARSQLAELQIAAGATVDQLTSAGVDAPAPATVTQYWECDGEFLCDGTITFAGQGTVALAPF